MCHCFLLQVWNWYIGNYSSCTFGHILRNSNPMLKERFMMILPRSPLWDEIWEPAKTLNSTDHIYENIANQYLKILHELPHDFLANEVFFFSVWTFVEIFYRKTSTMACLKQRNPRIQSPDSKFYETNSQNREKYTSTT